VMPVAGSASTGRGYYLCRRRALGAHAAVEVFSEWVRAPARDAPNPQAEDRLMGLGQGAGHAE
jgi:hypothetical protein